MTEPDAPLGACNAKRDFNKTAESAGVAAPLRFVVQKHWASHLHYDFRLELDGVMRSWAVPKGPCLDPGVKTLAIQVEDHPIDHNRFEGEIPKGQYGAGTVIVWDRGSWQPQGDAHAGLAKGKLVFTLQGQKLAGLWELVRISRPADKKRNQWLLFKKRDAWARPRSEYDVLTALPGSVIQKPASPPAQLAPQLATVANAMPAGGWSDKLAPLTRARLDR